MRLKDSRLLLRHWLYTVPFQCSEIRVLPGIKHFTAFREMYSRITVTAREKNSAGGLAPRWETLFEIEKPETEDKCSKQTLESSSVIIQVIVETLQITGLYSNINIIGAQIFRIITCSLGKRFPAKVAFIETVSVRCLGCNIFVRVRRNCFLNAG